MSANNTTRAPPGIKIYNAVYSSVQVYECMIRGIAVMRRRTDSYVNATQILKVAGIDKGRRTKILEKEILPGKHEIVQGGYGKYQGTWIPLERGRDVAVQFGVAHLLTPLFDYMPTGSNLTSFPTLPALAPARPPSGSPGFPSQYMGGYYPNQHSSTHQSQASPLAPPPILPGSALKLLHQGRAQGLFTPSSSSFNAYAHRTPTHTPPIRPPVPSGLQSPAPVTSQNYTTSPNLKRSRQSDSRQPGNTQSQDLEVRDSTPGSSSRQRSTVNGDRDGLPSPAKRPRIEPGSPVRSNNLQSSSAPLNGSHSQQVDALMEDGTPDLHVVRMAEKPSSIGSSDRLAPLRNSKRTALLSLIQQDVDPHAVLNLLLTNNDPTSGSQIDMDIVIDDQGHTPLHLAAALARDSLVELLIQNGANSAVGNYTGETPLIRAVLSTHSFQSQTFHALVALLHNTIRTLDNSNRTVLHHIAHIAGVKGRASAARYYMEGVLMWVAEHEGGDFKSLADVQDLHGDTALNIAARVGNRSLVKTLIDCGANRTLGNKLGLRPADFGLDDDTLNHPPRADDFLAQLRSAPSIPIQKSKDVIADITTMINSLSSDFSSEIKSKQEALASTQSNLRASTRSLADQRRQIQSWQGKCAELDQVHQRLRNLEKALADEDNFDWTGRSSVAGVVDTTGAFALRGPQSTLTGVGFDDLATHPLELDPPLPKEDSPETLVRMRRMRAWYARTESLMQARLELLQGASADKEFQCKKIVSLCTAVPMDQVEMMLENLVIAVESEAQVVDLGRVAGFMQKVRDGNI